MAETRIFCACRPESALFVRRSFPLGSKTGHTWRTYDFGEVSSGSGLRACCFAGFIADPFHMPGKGGGGNMVALCEGPDSQAAVARALTEAGYTAYETAFGGAT